MKTRVGLLLLLLASGTRAQQGTFTLAATPTAPGFSSASSSTCGAATLATQRDLVRTENLSLSLVSTPTTTGAPPAPRRLAIVLGVRDCTGFVSLGGSTIFVGLSGLMPLVPYDSFTNAFDPVFAAGASTLTLPLPLDLFGAWLGPLPPLVLQGIAEDLPGAPFPLLVSNAVELDVIDPQTDGFGPTISSISSPTSCPGTLGPGGPESGGTVITLTGVNYPVQSNWIQFPPTVLVGSGTAGGVVIQSGTTVTAVSPAVAPTCPPATQAGPKNVLYRNNTLVSPGAQFFVSPIKFDYCSERTPSVIALTLSTNPVALPEGGDQLVIAGTDFLYGAEVVFTAQGFGTLTTSISPADANVAATGPCSTNPMVATPTTITLTTPPFCTGSVDVHVVNPDGVASVNATLVYGSQAPAVTGVTPTTTVSGLAGPTTFSALADTGTPLNVSGTGFVSPSSPLFGAPTVPQGPSDLFPSRTQIVDGGVPLVTETVGVAASNLIHVTPVIGDQIGPFRPLLGLKFVRVVNPPCLAANPSAPNKSNDWPILVQDAAGPTILSFAPNVITPAAPAGVASSVIEIHGSNFFARRNFGPLPTSQVYGMQTGPAPLPVPVPSIGAIEVPAVSFGGLFSPEVELVSEILLRAKLPAGVTSQSAVSITVYNPDGRIATTSSSLHVVPRLTDPTKITPVVAPAVAPLDLNTATLLAISNPATNPYVADRAILFIPNPTANDDRLEDLANGGDPVVTGNLAAYDGCFLFNTRAADGTMRFFDFRSIDLPATIVLPFPISIGNQTISAGMKRVILKATALTVAVSPIVVDLYVDQNYPFVLRSHEDFTLGAMIDVSGDAMVNQAVATSPTLKFQFRSDWQVPPAGGGLGGRGGLYYLSNLIDVDTSPAIVYKLPTLASSLSNPSLATSANTLKGKAGFPPRERAASTVISEGQGGLGRAPIGGKAGGGGGGGFILGGGNGQAGATSSSAAGGAAFGNDTSLGPIPGVPPSDPYIYGTTSADFDGPLAHATSSFPQGLFAGGSGGGGGGGSLALVVPCVSIGGRGGNGGGSVVLLSDRVFRLGPFGRIFADGEKGQLGVDAFPFANGEPIFVLCAPGSGGGGSGGVIFIGAVADADLSAPVLPLNQRLLSASGGTGGAPTGATNVPTAHGGLGAGGRIRVVINELSTAVPQRRSEFLSRTAGGNIVPAPGPTVDAFFSYLTP